MKTFKLIDFWGTVLLIVASFVYAIMIRNEYAMLGYFVVGAWQVLSMLVHAINGWFNTGRGRRLYQLTVLWCFILAALGLLINSLLMIELFILLFAAPFMAIYYAWICYKELRMITSRPLAQLK